MDLYKVKHLGTPQAIEMMHCMVNVGFVYVQSPSSEFYLHCTFYSPGYYFHTK